MEAAESSLRAGDRLDRYELLCPIASGGMAAVWLARLRGKRGFEKLFAIKTIRAEMGNDPNFEEMFLDEARIASGIQHPNVAQILDLGEERETLFIVMEWVDGDSLAKIRKLVTKRGHKLPVGVVLRLLADACAGLHAAHELHDDQGQPLEIVHRDVSPQNLLVSTTGAVKVIDFGIAKAHNRKQGETRTGVVKGKIQYMAPEQVKKGRTVDRRADVWSLGVCLYELASGKLPYDGDDDIEVINKLLSDEAPKLAEGIPEPVERVLERCLVLDQDIRFPTAAGMQRALEGAMKELGVSTTTEDVASYVRSELPELAQKRREIVNRAIDEVRERGVPSSATTKVQDPDVAFAPTQVGERPDKPRVERPSDVGTVAAPPPTRREGAGREPPPPTNVSLALDQEPIHIPKTSKAWLWVTLAIVLGVGGAAYRWPDQARALAAKVGIGGESAPGLQAVPVPVDIVPGAASATASAPASASASASAPAPAPESASALAPPSASPSASIRPTPSSSHRLTWPGGSAPPAASGAPAAPALTTWSPYKTVAPAPSGGSSDNPYPGGSQP